MQSPARILYGIHSITPYNRVTKKPYGIMKAVGSASLNLSSDLEQLYAGSNKFAIAAEAKTVNAELSLRVKEYPNFLYELFLGATVVASPADAAGSVIGFVNVKGTSIKNVTNGISAIGVIPTTGKAELKEGKYLIVATGALTADIYGYSDVDFNRGTDMVFMDDSLKIGTIDLTSASADVAALGLSFTKAGTPVFVAGDTAEFEVTPPSDNVADILIGGSATTFPAFGAIVVAQKRATGEIARIEAFNVVASGLPIALEEQAFSQPEVTLAALYDRSKDGVFRIKHYSPAE